MYDRFPCLDGIADGSPTELRRRDQDIPGPHGSCLSFGVRGQETRKN